MGRSAGTPEALRGDLAALPPVLQVPTLVPARGVYRQVEVSLRPPGSKSLANRALLLAALAEGTSVLRGLPTDAEDVAVMLGALRALGATIEQPRPGEHHVRGVGGRWRSGGGCTLALQNAGTAVRFLAASAVLADGPVTLDGNARMRERPIGELADVLERLGCRVEYGGRPFCPPLTITPPARAEAPAGTLNIPTTQSSQFISALLLISPWLTGSAGVTVRLTGEVTSPSYISMTLGLLARLGARVRSSDDLRVLRVGPGGGVKAFEHDLEADASGATYWWGLGAMLPGASVRVSGIGLDSLQGDSRFPEVLARMGSKVFRGVEGAPFIGVSGPATLTPILADLADMPDAAMTLAAVACFAKGTSILRGLRTLRVKECDRIEALRTELTKFGVRVENPVQGDADAITITPPAGGLDVSAAAPVVECATYGDHRMAMSLAMLGVRRPNVRIEHPACVAKTYPDYWKHLAALVGGSGGRRPAGRGP